MRTHTGIELEVRSTDTTMKTEISKLCMSDEEMVISTREEQDRILKFVSVKVFSPDLWERIKSHFLAVQVNVSEEQEKFLMTLSHGLRVQLARKMDQK
jgi:hypothetical protein